MSIRVPLCSCQPPNSTTCQRVIRALLPGHLLPTALAGPVTSTVNLLQASRHLDPLHCFRRLIRFRLPVSRETDQLPDWRLAPALILN
jgi:hypothetical protein